MTVTTFLMSLVNPLLDLVNHALNVMIDVVLLTKLIREREAGEVLQPVPINGVNVKPNNERSKQPDVGQQRHPDEDAFPVLVERTEGDVGQEGKREQQAAEEAENVGDVVDPWQKAAQKEEEDDPHELEEGPPRTLQHLPALEQLHKQAREEAKLRSRWPHLSSVRQKKSRCEVSCDATKDIDEGDSSPACQFLQISQDGHLENHGHHAVHQPSVEEQGEPEPVKLIGNIRVEERQQSTHIV